MNYVLLVCMQLLCAFSIVLGINHWIVKNGLITSKIDSPFYMKSSNNLVEFLEQIKLNENVESSYLELLRQREQIMEHLRFSVQFGENLVEQAKCAMNYYLMEKRMSYLRISAAYQQRFQWVEPPKKSGPPQTTEQIEPICTEHVQLAACEGCYDHLETFRPHAALDSLHLEPEELSLGDVVQTADMVRSLALAQDVKSWKFHTLSSYYWRLRGKPLQALNCARLGVMLAPRSYKDIALLSLGTILYRCGRLTDADIVLTEAVEHAPHIPENQMALATVIAMKHDFNRSLYHFDEAEKLDPSLLPRTLAIRNFITCLDNLMKKTSKMYSYVEYMKNEVKQFKQLKFQISQKHEKLIQQQVPLGIRYSDSKSSTEDLHKRGQYCSTRTSNAAEPVLFCDFYSDMQMRLASKDVDIESLERDLRLTSEAVMRQVSAEFGKQLNYEKIKSMKAQVPTSNIGETTTSIDRNKGKDA